MLRLLAAAEEPDEPPLLLLDEPPTVDPPEERGADEVDERPDDARGERVEEEGDELRGTYEREEEPLARGAGAITPPERLVGARGTITGRDEEPLGYDERGMLLAGARVNVGRVLGTAPDGGSSDRPPSLEGAGASTG